jgi:hypothetical protein
MRKPLNHYVNLWVSHRKEVSLAVGHAVVRMRFIAMFRIVSPSCILYVAQMYMKRLLFLATCPQAPPLLLAEVRLPKFTAHPTLA